jgi:uncharacterized YccA/Bax inhibitor family protein
MFRTSNPTLRNAYFNESAAPSWSDRTMHQTKAASRTQMTMQGTVNKTAFLLALCAASALGAWTIMENNPGLAIPITFGGAILGLILVLIGSFKPKTSPFVAPLYAIAEGGFVGGVSMMFAANAAKPGNAFDHNLIFNAGLLTFGILGGLLAAYSMRLIRPNKTFYNIVIAGTIGAALYAVIAMVASMFGSFSLASVYDPNNGGLIAVGFSSLLVVLASANLVLDFDQIENGVRNNAPKHMEWFAGMSLLVTLVWLYVNLLRLLSQLRRD